MRINYQKLERDIPEIAAHVEAASRLKVPLETLNFEVANAPTENHAVAEYFSQQKKIKIYQNQINFLYSQNQVKIFLGHELMHHAQSSIEPTRQIVETLLSESQSQPLRRLLEGDATWVGLELGQVYPRDVFSETYHFLRVGFGLQYAGLLLKGVAAADYGLGKRIIDALVADGGREAVNRLYYTANLDEITRHFDDQAVEKIILPLERQTLTTLNEAADAIYGARKIIGSFQYEAEKIYKNTGCKANRLFEILRSRRARNWLEVKSKKDPEIAKFKRIYDEIAKHKRK